MELEVAEILPFLLERSCVTTPPTCCLPFSKDGLHVYIVGIHPQHGGALVPSYVPWFL